MSRPLRIAHLYPELLNLYADKGNIQTLRKRCEWRDIDVSIHLVQSSERVELSQYDLVLLGGGSDREQEIVGRTLRSVQREWRESMEAGLPILGICGGYQLLGEYYQLPDGTKVPGLELVDLVTTSGSPRFIGNVAIDSPKCGRIVGFENHAGRTTHPYAPLGTVVRGNGNNGEDGQEGIHHLNVIGTYIHGPLLPKNPQLADYVLQTAIDYAGLGVKLDPLDDRIERAAQEAFQTRRMNLERVK